jgi:HK97 family phage major capsid protein
VAEAGTITASDPTFAAGTAIPHKVAVRVEYSNEVADDSSPELEGVLRQVLAGRAAVTVDVAAYEGSGVGATPLGMGNQVGVGNVNASAAATSITWGASAISTLEAANAPRPYSYAGAANLPKHLRGVRVDSGGTVGPYLFPVGDEELPVLWGARGYVNSALASGTAYVYSPSSCFVVNRVNQFDIEVDRSRLFHIDSSEMRLKARLDFFFPYPTAIVRGTAVPA